MGNRSSLGGQAQRMTETTERAVRVSGVARRQRSPLAPPRDTAAAGEAEKHKSSRLGVDSPHQRRVSTDALGANRRKHEAWDKNQNRRTDEFSHRTRVHEQSTSDDAIGADKSVPKATPFRDRFSVKHHSQSATEATQRKADRRNKHKQNTQPHVDPVHTEVTVRGSGAAGNVMTLGRGASVPQPGLPPAPQASSSSPARARPASSASPSRPRLAPLDSITNMFAEIESALNQAPKAKLHGENETRPHVTRWIEV